MAYILFIDESGNDQQESPYEVTAGVAVEDRKLWQLIKEIHKTEVKTFGRRYSDDASELKAKKLLKRKTFRLAAQMPPIPEAERKMLAKACLDDGVSVSKQKLTALAQAKLTFITQLLRLLKKYDCKIFASVVSPDFNRRHHEDLLRKDYVYLLERYFYFLNHLEPKPSGLIVMDETEKTSSKQLISQIENYFKKTEKGRFRARLLVPEPLFVHSDLTTGVQLADIVAYLVSWAWRMKGMDEPAREELKPYTQLLTPLLFSSQQIHVDQRISTVYSIQYIKEKGNADRSTKPPSQI